MACPQHPDLTRQIPQKPERSGSEDPQVTGQLIKDYLAISRSAVYPAPGQEHAEYEGRECAQVSRKSDFWLVGAPASEQA